MRSLYHNSSYKYNIGFTILPEKLKLEASHLVDGVKQCHYAPAMYSKWMWLFIGGNWVAA